MKKILYIIYLSFILSPSLSAQNKIKIINADNSQMLNDSEYIKLYGNCHFRHNNSDMYCDTLYFYDSKNYIKAHRNIKIVQENKEKDNIIIKSDSLNYDGNKSIATLKQNVNMTNGNTNLLTNYFVYNTKSKIGTYYEGGTIINQNDILKSETGTYDTNTKIADFNDNINITSPDNIILTNTLKYNNDLQIAYIKAPTKIINNYDQSLLYSEDGFYNTKTTQAELYKNAYYESKDKYFTADTLLLNQKTKTNTLKENALIIDKINNTRSASNFATFNDLDSTGLLTNNILIKTIKDGDTFYLTSDSINTLSSAYKNLQDVPDITEFKIYEDIDLSNMHIIPFFNAPYNDKLLYLQFNIPKTNINYTFSSINKPVYYFYTYNFVNAINKTYDNILKQYPTYNPEQALNDKSQIITASKNVKVFNDSIQLIAESFLYIKEKSLVYITGNPILWVNNTIQITSKDMVFTLKDSKLDKGYFITDPIIVSQDEEDKTRFNQIKGRVVIATFLDNKLNKIDINGNAESIYHVKEENTKNKNATKYIGLNSTKASSIELSFKNNTLLQAKYLISPLGTITPYNLVEEKSENLEGFSWDYTLRPKSKADLLPKDKSYLSQKYINEL